MQVTEALTMESGTTFTTRRGYTISRATVWFFILFFLSSLLAVGFLVYNYAACHSLTISHETICNHHGSKTITHLPGGTVIISNDDNAIQHPDHGSSVIPKSPKDDLNTKKKDIRLPRSIAPTAYDLKLIPYLIDGNYTYDGTVRIHVIVKEECTNITLHAVELGIDQEGVVVSTMQGNMLPIKKQYSIDAKQFYVIEFEENLKKGEQYEVIIPFKGYLLDFLQGFYRSSYQHNNETRFLAATQFQPTDARKAFPCFDEPALKAKFNLSIARPVHMKSISNMPKVAGPTNPVENLPGYVWDIYQESVPMSTYLLAFVVSDFSQKTNGNFSVWARQNGIRSAEYALDVGPKILRFFEKFFNIPFPLPKIDMIALPDFHAGAMENWGLITYRETAMLYEEGVSASGIKQRVATVVAHELAHQWFGNLVTPSWWSDIWLNEGFASYMEYLGVAAVEPSWKPMDQFVVNELQNVFTLDALSSSHKISVAVNNPDEINEMFDRISYGKGSTIIRMMNHFLTTDIFREGLSNYLKEMSYKSAEQDDLWKYLTESAIRHNLFDRDMSVKEIMDTWTLQSGFPVITVKYDSNEKRFLLDQSKFSYVKGNKTETPAKDGSLWWVPLTYTTSKILNFSNTQPSAWMRKTRTAEIKDVDISSSDWFIFNIQQTGYYRVSYDESNWKRIIEHLNDPIKFKEIAPANRAQLIDDAMNLARGGYLNYKMALEITRYLIHEDDYVPWKAAITGLNFIDSMMIKGGDYFLMKTYMLHILKQVYDRVGFDDSKNRTDMLTIYKRIDILTTACHLGQRDCVQNCGKQYQNWMATANPDSYNPISPNLKSLVYCTAIKYGAEEEWDFAFQRFLKTTVSSEKEILLSALGCSREAWILNRYLRRSITEHTGIRKQDVFRVFAAVSSNVIGQPIAFNFVRNHWPEIQNYMGAHAFNLNSIVKYTTRRMNNRFELEELLEYVRVHHKDAQRSVQQAVERVEVNIAWMDRNYQSIVNWLNKTTTSWNQSGV